MSALLGQGQPHSLQTSNSGSVWRSDRQVSTNESSVLGAAARRSLKSALSGRVRWTWQLQTERLAVVSLGPHIAYTHYRGWWSASPSLLISFQYNLYTPIIRRENGWNVKTQTRKVYFCQIPWLTMNALTDWRRCAMKVCRPALEKLAKFMEQFLHHVTGE